MSYSDEQLISAIVASPTQNKAAALIGCHRSTITRRMHDDAFAAKVMAAKLSEMRTQLAGAAARYTLACDCLVDIIENSHDDGLRLRAAAELLRYS